MEEPLKQCINCKHLKMEAKTYKNMWGAKSVKGICQLTGLDMNPFDYTCNCHEPVKQEKRR